MWRYLNHCILYAVFFLASCVTQIPTDAKHTADQDNGGATSEEEMAVQRQTEADIHDESGTQGQQCVTLCDQWERECLVNSTTGVRKCRRVCKALVRECN